MAKPKLSSFDRFMQQVYPEPNTGCWLWGGKLTKGYGQLTVDGRSGLRAYRFAYEHFKGPIPEGLQLDHLCRVRCCVNPDHLEPVTARENVLRGIGITAINSRKTHCKRGHPLSGSNLGIMAVKKSNKIQRFCRECNSMNRRRRMGCIIKYKTRSRDCKE